MKIKKKYKTIIKIFLLILLLMLIITINRYKKRNYSIDYKIYGVEINQRYNKEKEYYKLTLKHNNKTYKTIIYSDKYYKKQIINKIDIMNEEKYTCISSKSKYININILCSDNEEYYSYDYIKTAKEDYKKISTYNNINIYNTNNKNILSWKYDGFNIINNKESKVVKLLNNDEYDISLAYQKGEFIIIPNYDEEYEFTKIITYNIKKDTIDTLELKDPISFDAYIMGDYKKSIYIYDLKNKQEYEFVPYKNKIRKSSTQILLDGKWQKTTDSHIQNNKPTFSSSDEIRYEISNGNLYKIIDNYKEMIATEVKYIVSAKNNDVYYLKDDSLYYKNFLAQEKLLLNNFEWTFNYENMIYIY